MAVKSKMTKNSAKQWIGQPVYIELKDGSTYWGFVTEAKSGQLIVSGQRSPYTTKMVSTKRGGKAAVSGFIPGLLGSMVGGSSMFGGGIGGIFSGAGGLGGGSLGNGLAGSFGNFESIMGLMGNMGKTFPVMKMGYGMIKSIMPILKMF
ncbi:hypothetical protein [Paenibacillus lignilyticus]|uniref:Uncharacterized protein n=1 Tax=Paenibacillus lignilyticus TaxID=1172615 RepID=A0ABS5CAN6_9BACL|nr:hypothetical protein [Paenibacillus lignilyticus]MBP3963059.1 hypothetical protein [Paenibacillus lignilyticus]